jgi:hypothetical protein
MNRILIMLFFTLVTLSASAEGITKTANIYFDDGSVIKNTKVQLVRKTILVNYQNDKLRIYFSDIKSLKITDVYPSKEEPRVDVEIILKNGKQFTIRNHYTGLLPFGEDRFKIRVENPMTGRLKFKGYDWIGHDAHKCTNGGPSYWVTTYRNKSRFKRVYKLVFLD